MTAGGGTLDLSGLDDQSAWFTTDSSGNVASLAGDVKAQFSTLISNTGDLSSSNVSARIQIGGIPGDVTTPPRVLGVDGNGNVVSEPWDRLSAQQIWSYLDWDKGNYCLLLSRIEADIAQGATLLTSNHQNFLLGQQPPSSFSRLDPILKPPSGK